jgi:hypothetical protein
MIFLFRHGSLRTKTRLVLSATRQHARNLGLFSLVYKAMMMLFRQLRSGESKALSGPAGAAKDGQYDSFIAGLVGGYVVFGRSIDSPVSQQIVIYVFARVALAVAKLMTQPKGASGSGLRVSAKGEGWGLLDASPELREKVMRYAWTAFASLSWASVMYMFRWHPETIQPSLRSSMHYMYVFSCISSSPR